MAPDRDVAEAFETASTATLLNNYITRLDEQMEYSLADVEIFDPMVFADMATMIGRLSADGKAREHLTYCCSDLIKHMHRQYPWAPLTEKKVGKVKQAILWCFGRHFGGWEELMQATAAKVVSHVRVLEEQTAVQEQAVNQLASILQQGRAEKPTKGDWKDRRKERLAKRGRQ